VAAAGVGPGAGITAAGERTANAMVGPSAGIAAAGARAAAYGVGPAAGVAAQQHLGAMRGAGIGSAYGIGESVHEQVGDARIGARRLPRRTRRDA
jgi:hypothetical protein